MVWIIVSGQVRNRFQFSEIVFMKFSPGRLWRQHSNWSGQWQPKHKDMKLLAVGRNWNIFLWREHREWDDGEKWVLIMDVCVCVCVCVCVHVLMCMCVTRCLWQDHSWSWRHKQGSEGSVVMHKRVCTLYFYQQRFLNGWETLSNWF